MKVAKRPSERRSRESSGGSRINKTKDFSGSLIQEFSRLPRQFVESNLMVL